MTKFLIVGILLVLKLSKRIVLFVSDFFFLRSLQIIKNTNFEIEN